MDAQELRNLQEAYMEVYDNEMDEAYVDFTKDRKDSLGRPKLSPRGKALTKAMSSLQPKPGVRHRDDEKNKGRSEKIKTTINSFDSKKVQAKSAANKERGENKKKAFGNRLMRSDKQGIRDSYDYYDIILSHLLDEGYAETEQAATAIMVNMSEEWRESIMIDEGLDMKTFMANRKKAKASATRADAVKRGHVGKEWYNSGRRYSPDEARRGRANMDDEERRTRHRSAVDPDNENDDNFSADKTKNPKKLRKQKAMGEH